MAQKKLKILFIKNVFKTDCLDLNKEIERRINENDQFKPNIFDVNFRKVNLLSSYVDRDYQKNPTIFESIDTWPRTTNLHCWYCFNQFTGQPKFVPVVIEPGTFRNKSRYQITVEGNFCRWSCCKSSIKETTNDLTKYTEKYNNLCFLYSIWTGKYPRYIPDAPSKYLQIAFGGDLTKDQYYAMYDEVETVIQ